jgi:hypothetical protein
VTAIWILLLLLWGLKLCDSYLLYRLAKMDHRLASMDEELWKSIHYLLHQETRRKAAEQGEKNA